MNIKLIEILLSFIIGSFSFIPNLEVINTKILVDEFNSFEYKKEQAIENGANEMGAIMVVMYHNLVDDSSKEGAYARSYDNFKKDLERLYEENYVPINMDELISGNFNVPLGKTPIVLTFDDAHSSDIVFDENGNIARDCVIGIFEEMQKEHPDFIPKATFYVNTIPIWGDKIYDKRKSDYLINHGYEIGNHTKTHANLRKVDYEKFVKEIKECQEVVSEMTGKKDFNFALPFGEKPKNYFDLLENQDWLSPYILKSSVNVGWNPIVSVYNKDFNPFSINRITCGSGDVKLDYWLDDFKKNPKKRFISDGMQNVITFPKVYEEKFNKEKFKNFEINMY